MRTEIDMRQLAKDFERHEGRRYSAYQDQGGHWHIGVGRLIDGTIGGAVSDEEIDLMLVNDIERHIGDLDKVLPWWRGLSEVRQRALALMALQLGVPRLREFTKMLSALQKENWHVAALEARASRWAAQTPERAKEVADMLQKG